VRTDDREWPRGACRRVNAGLGLGLAVACWLGCQSTPPSSPAPSAANAPSNDATSDTVSSATEVGDGDGERRGVDVHLHLKPPAIDGAAAVAALDDAGLARGVVLSPGYHLAEGCAALPCEAQRAHTEAMNDWALAEAAQAPARLLAFCGVPWMAAWGPAEVARCARAGARGLKLHQVNAGVSLKDTAAATAFVNLLLVAAKHQLPVLVHVAMDDEEEVRAFFALAPVAAGVQLIAAHQLAPSLALLAEAPDNVWIEVSGLTHAPAAAGNAFVPVWRAMGMQRVLLGSDFPLLSPKAHVDMLKAYPLTDDERHQILVDNPARLFGER
jgi:predicted TIM-barrel fold metal-dependent hydrolase